MIAIDTHIIIWDALQPASLSEAARLALAENQETGIIICDISLWEIAMLMKKGRLKIDVDYQAFIALVLQANNYLVHQISPQIADIATSLPAAVNKYPADRLIAATAIAANVPLVTADENLRAADVIATLW